MRKLHALLLAVLLTLAFVSPSFAEVGIKKDGVSSSIATDIDFKSMGSAISSDGSTLTFNLALTGVGNAGSASQMASGTLAVPTSYAYVSKFLSATVGAAGTLADGYPGQILAFSVSDVISSGTFVLTPTTKTGFSTLTFDAVNDSVTLLFVSSTTGWIILASNSVTIAN